MANYIEYDDPDLKFKGSIVPTKAYVDTNAAATGWIAAGETWTYAASDDPTYTLTISGDKTDKYSAGMKVKLTDSGTQYFIITKVAYSDPDTTLTLYGGTDYDLSSGAITSPYYSTQKAPHGFPLDPDDWTVLYNSSSDFFQLNPTSETWYNIGTVGIDIPIGVWNVRYEVCLYSNDTAANDHRAYVTLSTANNSESDDDFTANVEGGNQINYIGATVGREKILNLTTKDTYYLNAKEVGTGIYSLYFFGTHTPTIIRAVCAYL